MGGDIQDTPLEAGIKIPRSVHESPAGWEFFYQNEEDRMPGQRQNSRHALHKILFIQKLKS